MKLLFLFLTALAGIACLSTGANTTATATAPAEHDAMTKTETSAGDFYKNLPAGFEIPKDEPGNLLLREYGAVYLARGGAKPPTRVVFRDEADVAAFQNSVERSARQVGGLRVELQTVALDALANAIAEAGKIGLSIEPRGADSARRGYDQTVGLWESRVNPGLAHWVAKGRVTADEAKRIKALSPFQQVPEILRLEREGIFFARSLDKSIIYSVAPPGTSQHIAMLALDVKQFDNAKVREILANHGWFQTVISDLPHFTFLGVKKTELSKLGLKEVTNSGRSFWIPNI